MIYEVTSWQQKAPDPGSAALRVWTTTLECGHVYEIHSASERVLAPSHVECGVCKQYSDLAFELDLEVAAREKARLAAIEHSAAIQGPGS